MPVDLGDLVEPLRAAVNPPGDDFFPTATEDDWMLRLANGFWDAYLMGFFRGYREADGSIIATSAAVELLPRDQQQFIVLFAAYKTVLTKLLSLATGETYKAGPVEVSTQRSAGALQLVLADIKEQLDTLVRVAGEGPAAAVGIAVFDNMLRRNDAALAQAGYFVR